jgi:thiamine-monophosphate kinase
MVRLSEMGEDALIARLVAGLPSGAEVVVGPGDDCAVVQVPGSDELQLLKTDCIVESVHFLKEAAPERVGWKAVARVLSDVAAMGGTPDHLLVTLVVSQECTLEWVDGVYAGMTRCASRFGASIVGGECSRLPEGSPAVLSVSGTGRVNPKALVLRSGGRVGDSLYVTGRLGGSLAGKHLDFVPRLEEASCLVSRKGVRAMMDLSDGLAMDLPRLARASGCGFVLEESAIPCNAGVGVKEAVGDGEDYELLLAVDPWARSAVETAWRAQFPDLPLTRIGELCEGEAGEISGGWDHFGGG